jgi:hypothetical protein
MTTLFNVQVLNTAGQGAFLYVGETNALQITFTNVSGGDVALTAPFGISLDFDLPPSVAGGLSLTDAAGGSITPEENGVGVAWPNGGGIAAGGALTFLLEAEVDAHQVAGAINLLAFWLDDGVTVTLPLIARPGAGLKTLTLNSGWADEVEGPLATYAARGTVLVTGADLPRIHNRLALRLQNPSRDKIVVGRDARPVFYINLPTSPSSHSGAARFNALCTEEEARDVQARVETDGTSWTVSKDADRPGRFILEPDLLPAGVLLDIGQSVIVYLDNLVTTLQPFTSSVHIVARGLDGYEDGYFVTPVQKRKPLPTIARFDANYADQFTGPAYQGQPVTLSWETWGTEVDRPVSILSDGVGLVQANLPASGELVVHPTAVTTYYRLILNCPNAPADAHVTLFVGTVTAEISASKAVVAPGEPVTISYKLANASKFSIAPGVIEERPGAQSIVQSLDHAQTSLVTYVLTAHGLGGPVTASVTVDLPLPLSDNAIYMILADDQLWEMDRNRQFTSCAKLPAGTGNAVASLEPHGGQLYFANGGPVAWRYDTATRTLTELTTSNDPRNSPGPNILTFEELVDDTIWPILVKGHQYQLVGDQVQYPGRDGAMGNWDGLLPGQKSRSNRSWWSSAEGIRSGQGSDVIYSDTAFELRTFDNNAFPETGSWSGDIIYRASPTTSRLTRTLRSFSRETGRPIAIDADLCEARIGDTTALAVGASGDIYWFENDAEGGPQLCRYFAAEKRRDVVAKLPAKGTHGALGVI